MFFLRGSFHILGSFVLSGSLAQKRVKAPQLPRPAGQTLWQEQSLCKTDKNKTYPLRNNKNNKLCRFTLEFDTVILQSYLKAPQEQPHLPSTRLPGSPMNSQPHPWLRAPGVSSAPTAHHCTQPACFPRRRSITKKTLCCFKTQPW